LRIDSLKQEYFLLFYTRVNQIHILVTKYSVESVLQFKFQCTIIILQLWIIVFQSFRIERIIVTNTKSARSNIRILYVILNIQWTSSVITTSGPENSECVYMLELDNLYALIKMQNYAVICDFHSLRTIWYVCLMSWYFDCVMMYFYSIFIRHRYYNIIYYRPRPHNQVTIQNGDLYLMFMLYFFLWLFNSHLIFYYYFSNSLIFYVYLKNLFPSNFVIQQLMICKLSLNYWHINI